MSTGGQVHDNQTDAGAPVGVRRRRSLLDRVISPWTSMVFAVVAITALIVSLTLASQEPNQSAGASAQDGIISIPGSPAPVVVPNAVPSTSATSGPDVRPTPTTTAPTPSPSPAPAPAPVPVPAAAVSKLPGVAAPAPAPTATPKPKPKPSATAVPTASPAPPAVLPPPACTAGLSCTTLAYAPDTLTLTGTFPCGGQLHSAETDTEVILSWTQGEMVPGAECAPVSLSTQLQAPLAGRPVIDVLGDTITVT